MMLIFQVFVQVPGMNVGFNVVSNKTINDSIQKLGLERLSAPIKNLIDASVPFRKNEIIDFYAGINPNWRKAIELLNSERMISFHLTPVGTYIGSRQLVMLSGRDIPLDIFYK